MRILLLILALATASAQTYINGSRTIEGTLNYCSDAGSTDSYSCSLSPAITGYVTGTAYVFRANTANTGAASINFNSLGAKTIVKQQNVTLADNDIKAGQLVEVIYDGTNMQMISPPSTGGGASTTTWTFTAPAAGCSYSVAATGWQIESSTTAPDLICITGSNAVIAAAEFDANERMEVRSQIPPGWSGTVTATFLWRATVTSGSATWAIQFACVADGETLDPSWNTATTIADTAAGTSGIANTATTAAITLPGNCAAGSSLLMRVYLSAHTLSGAKPQLVRVTLQGTRTL